MKSPEEIVDAIQAQNWKNGGVLTFDRMDAIEMVAESLEAYRMAGKTDGRIEGLRDAVGIANDVLRFGGHAKNVGEKIKIEADELERTQKNSKETK